jgi:hypothetical protein
MDEGKKSLIGDGSQELSKFNQTKQYGTNNAGAQQEKETRNPSRDQQAEVRD